MRFSPQIGQAFKPDHADTEYDRGSYMLKTLGLQVWYAFVLQHVVLYIFGYHLY